MIWKGPAAALTALSVFVLGCAAQDIQISPSVYVDAPTGINFSAWSVPSGDDGRGAFTFGFALPPDALTKDATEYIGMLQCQTISTNLTGWCGIAHAGHMTSDLLLMAWPDGRGQVRTSFRWINDYFMPPQFGGASGQNGTSAAFPPPTLSVIRAAVNTTGFHVLYRCQNCFAFAQGESNETVHTAGDPDNVLVLGYAQAARGPLNPTCPGDSLAFGFHDNGYAQWGAPVAHAVQADYVRWTALATGIPGNGTTTASCAAPKRRARWTRV